MKFQDMPYKRPDKERLFATITELTERFEKAFTVEEQMDVIEKIDQENKTFDTMATLANIRNTIDTRDAFYETERQFFDEVSPLLSEKMDAFKRVLVNSKFRSSLEEKYGKTWFINTEIALKAFAPELVPLMQEENQLTAQYQKLYASAQIPFEGEICTIAKLTLYKQSEDRQIRKRAYEAEGQFFDEHQEEFDEIYDKLIKNRTKQAKMLGFNNYVELGYLRNTRNCYGPAEVENFRRQIVEDVVPVVMEIKKTQAKRIGIEDFKFYDDAFVFPDGNAMPHGTPEQIMAAGKEMYTALSKETAEFIQKMYDMDLFDVIAKDGKAPGGYCTYISDYNCPFVFSNFNGTAGDVDVLTHEVGHAFGCAQAAKNVPVSDVLWPTSDGAEVQSMSMEFLTAPYHHLFFEEETEKYELYHAEDSVTFLPYGCEVDHFQHLVYENPDWTPEERNQAWARLEKIYRPYVDHEGMPFYGRGAGWQRQLHIYQYPFYYIDYCLAQIIALQIWSLSLKDWDEAWKTYLKFVRQGGMETFVDLVKSVGLRSPFDDGSLKEVCQTTEKWLHEKWGNKC